MGTTKGRLLHFPILELSFWKDGITKGSGFWILWFGIFSLLVLLVFAVAWCFHFAHCIACDDFFVCAGCFAFCLLLCCSVFCFLLCCYAFLWCVLVALLFVVCAGCCAFCSAKVWAGKR